MLLGRHGYVRVRLVGQDRLHLVAQAPKLLHVVLGRPAAALAACRSGPERLLVLLALLRAEFGELRLRQLLWLSLGSLLLRRVPLHRRRSRCCRRRRGRLRVRARPLETLWRVGWRGVRRLAATVISVVAGAGVGHRRLLRTCRRHGLSNGLHVYLLLDRRLRWRLHRLDRRYCLGLALRHALARYGKLLVLLVILLQRHHPLLVLLLLLLLRDERLLLL